MPGTGPDRDSVFIIFLNFTTFLSVRYLVMSTEQMRKPKVREVNSVT